MACSKAWTLARCGQPLRERRAACALGLRKHGIEHGAAGIGIHLDQAEAATVEVEVVAEEDAARSTDCVVCVFGSARGGWRGRQHLGAEGRQRHDCFHRLDHVSHALQVLRADEHRLGREQVRAAFAHRRRQAGVAEGRIQRAGQRGLVKAEAEAVVVQRTQGRQAGE